VTDRVVAVVIPAPADREDVELVVAMLEDVVDLVADTPEVTGALVEPPGCGARADAVAWPGTARVEVATDPTLAELLQRVRGLATSAVAVVVPDVPDLPTLLLGKLFSALAGPPRLELAICPADGGGLVAVAIPVDEPADWLAALDVHLDDVDALDRIRAAAPPRALAVGPGWHRTRSRADLDRLDPGLEGWDATRALQ
jgi:2-phospho-L-lactate guanylyltransferase (CobY/MobA/RfbA family)